MPSLLHIIYLISITSCTHMAYKTFFFNKSKKLYSTSTKLFSNMNFYSTPESEMKEIFKTWGQPSFRIDQVKKWVYEKGILDFNKMDNLPISLRERLNEFFTFGSLKLISEQVSKDGTRKRAYELYDGYIFNRYEVYLV